jgi:hypothetical protein
MVSSFNSQVWHKLCYKGTWEQWNREPAYRPSEARSSLLSYLFYLYHGVHGSRSELTGSDRCL